MRFKFYVLIFLSFILAISISNHFFSELIKKERLALIDSEIEKNASQILKTSFLKSPPTQFNETDEILERIFQGHRMGLVILVRDEQGKLLFRNKNAYKLELNPPYRKRWQLLTREGNYIRLLSLEDKRQRRILQFGSLINKSSLSIDYTHILQNNYVVAGLILSAAVAYFLTLIILRPLRKLKDHIEYLTHSLQSNNKLKLSLDRVFTNKKGFFSAYDELHQLLQAFAGFLENFKKAIDNSRIHTARLAHEINTPLTIIRNHVAEVQWHFQSLSERPEHIANHLQEINEEITNLANFARDYVDWVQQAHTSHFKSELFALNLRETVEQVTERLRPLHEGRIQVTIESPQTSIIANPKEVEHVLVNLLINALKYSPQNLPIELHLKDMLLSIRDHGPGIEEEVLKNMGGPFNKGRKHASSAKMGHGLGLAWVMMIVSKYQWKLNIETSSAGTIFRLDFSSPS